MSTIQYRLASGEVLRISSTNNLFEDRDTRYYGVQVDPPFPDGTELRPRNPDGSLGEMRVLGYAKHWDGTNCRNATQPEIDTYKPAQDAERDAQDAERASDLGGVDPIWRKIFKAIIKLSIDENNVQATRYNELRGELLAATSLQDMQNRVRDNTTDMPSRTYQQGYDAVRDLIDPKD